MNDQLHPLARTLLDTFQDKDWSLTDEHAFDLLRELKKASTTDEMSADQRSAYGAWEGAGYPLDPMKEANLCRAAIPTPPKPDRAAQARLAAFKGAHNHPVPQLADTARALLLAVQELCEGGRAAIGRCKFSKEVALALLEWSKRNYSIQIAHYLLNLLKREQSDRFVAQRAQFEAWQKAGYPIYKAVRKGRNPFSNPLGQELHSTTYELLNSLRKDPVVALYGPEAINAVRLWKEGGCSLATRIVQELLLTMQTDSAYKSNTYLDAWQCAGCPVYINNMEGYQANRTQLDTYPDAGTGGLNALNFAVSNLSQAAGQVADKWHRIMSGECGYIPTDDTPTVRDIDNPAILSLQVRCGLVLRAIARIAQETDTTLSAMMKRDFEGVR